MRRRHLNLSGLREVIDLQMAEPAAVLMMAMAVVVMMLVMMNSLARFFGNMLDTGRTTGVAAIMHSIIARSGHKEEQDKHERQYVMKYLTDHFFSGLSHEERSGQSLHPPSHDCVRCFCTTKIIPTTARTINNMTNIFSSIYSGGSHGSPIKVACSTDVVPM